ncbi:OmpA family protein [Nisaea nitritireducens]|uniref:OmpA family protein n=1 Tax=Nisaea nitritireducens TaxID=568392 RepID=UPI001867DE01|nr:OmpA family protein [Nisaea nitritireducens]
MAGSTYQGKCPVFLLLAGLIGLQAGPALSQETIYIGGTGSSVEINLDVLDQLGTPQTIPQMLQTDIRRGQVAAGAPLPLPGEARAAVSRGVPMPPPTRPASSQSRRVVTAGSTALPGARAPQQPTLPTARSTARNLAPTTIAPRAPAASKVPAPARVAAPVPSAPKVARTPTPIVAPPAKVAIAAPEPKAPKSAPKAIAKVAPKTTTKIPDIEIPAAPKAATRTAAIAPPPPPPAVTAPSVSAPTPTAKAPEPAKQVASASPAPKAAAPVPKASSAGAAISITFDTETKSLPTNASGTLNEVAEKMKADKSMRVQLLAYASAGERSEAKARRLSLSRALEVRSYLIGKGVASTRMDVRALGNQAPSGSPDRVDLTLINR